MSLIYLNTFSKELEQITEITLIVPEMFNRKKSKALILLHGYIGNNKDWTRYSHVEDLANEYNVLVIMPSANNSFYTNMVHGFNYFNFVSNELLEIVNHNIQYHFTNEKTYIAGLSMGGYGAMKIALTNPKRYAGVASLSGALNIKNVYEKFDNRNILKAAFGNEDTFSKNIAVHDLFLLSKNNDLNNLDIYLACGFDDFLIEDSRLFSKHLKSLNINYKYNETEGDHTWPYWRKEIDLVFSNFFK